MTVDHELGVTCTGILVLAYLTSVIHKFNGVMRKEVALKEECSQLMCWGLAAFAGAQPIAILLILYQQQLWTNFYLMPAAVDGVSSLGQCICEVLLGFGRFSSACNVVEKLLISWTIVGAVVELCLQGGDSGCSHTDPGFYSKELDLTAASREA